MFYGVYVLYWNIVQYIYIMYLTMFHGVFSDFQLVYIGRSIVYFRMFAKYLYDIFLKFSLLHFLFVSLCFALDCIIFLF
jgi:hypothetical protein